MKETVIKNYEYEKILQKLENLQQQKEQLKSKKKEYLQRNFTSYIDPLINIILFLKRENQQILQQINFEKKKFLASFSNNKILYLKIKNHLDIFLFYFIHSYQTFELTKANLITEITFLNQIPTFFEFQTTIEPLVQKQDENFQLIQKINLLLKEQELLLVEKKNLEKSKNKKNR